MANKISLIDDKTGTVDIMKNYFEQIRLFAWGFYTNIHTKIKNRQKVFLFLKPQKYMSYNAANL